MNKTTLTYSNQLEFKKFAFKNGLKRKCDFYFDDVDCVDAKTSSNIPKIKCDGTLTYEKALKKLVKYFENKEKLEAKEAKREAKAAAKAKRDAKRAKEIEKKRKKAEAKKAKREAKKMKDAIRKEKERAKKQALKEKKMQKKANAKAKAKPIASANSNISEKDLLKLVKQYVNDKVTGIVGCIKYRNDLDTLVNKLNKNNKFFSVNATDNTDGTTTVSVRFTDVIKTKTKKFKRTESTNDIVVEPIVEVNQPTENEVAPENDMNTTIETENTNEVIADEVSMPDQPTENDMIIDDDGDELIDDIDVRDPDEIADEVIDEENADDEDDDFEEEDDRRFDDETDEDKVDYRREYYEDDDMLADFEQ